jgi:hypothetical protein
MDYHRAEINIGRRVAPIDQPQVAEFVAAPEPFDALAPGFAWRLESASAERYGHHLQR